MHWSVIGLRYDVTEGYVKTGFLILKDLLKRFYYFKTDQLGITFKTFKEKSIKLYAVKKMEQSEAILGSLKKPACAVSIALHSCTCI